MNATIAIREWDVPTPNSRPHDPAVAPDGSLWYTGQTANKLGRFDPKSGQFKEFPLKTPDSGPHGLAADQDGNIWFTAVFKGYIGKLNPATGEITEYHMPDPRATDPHTPVFDQKGMLWFTTEQSNFVGRLDPKFQRLMPCRMELQSCLPEFPISVSLGRTNWPASIPSLWRSRSTKSPKEPALAASRWQPMEPFITRTSSADILDILIQRPGRSKNGSPRVVRDPRPTGSR